MNLIEQLLQKHKKIHFSLIDPVTQSPNKAGEIAKICEEKGTNGIMVGGSTVMNSEVVYRTIDAIKNNVKLPIILFPNSAKSISRNVDYIFFMMLLNSLDNRYMGREQVLGTPLIKKWNIEPVSMGYVVVSTSKKPTTIEQIVKLDKIKIGDIEKAVVYAEFAEMLGMSCVYFDAGSGAEQPISNEMIKAVRVNINIPIVIGGGIKDGRTAKEKIDAGADVIVNGTILEREIKIIEEIINCIRT